MVTSSYTIFHDLSEMATEAPDDSIVSRTLYDGDDSKLVLFAFDAGQSLSEHTAARPAVLHILEGEVSLTLGDDEIEAKRGAWIRMDANLPHSVNARTRVVMALELLGGRA